MSFVCFKRAQSAYGDIILLVVHEAFGPRDANRRRWHWLEHVQAANKLLIRNMLLKRCNTFWANSISAHLFTLWRNKPHDINYQYLYAHRVSHRSAHPSSYWSIHTEHNCKPTSMRLFCVLFAKKLLTLQRDSWDYHLSQCVFPPRLFWTFPILHYISTMMVWK